MSATAAVPQEDAAQSFREQQTPAHRLVIPFVFEGLPRERSLWRECKQQFRALQAGISVPGTLVIVPCGASKIWAKQPHMGAMMAKDAYTGPPFILHRQYAERFGDGWVILSAKYGFLTPEAPLPDGQAVIEFMVLLDTSSVEVFAAGGRVVLTDLLLPDAPVEAVRFQTVTGHPELEGSFWQWRSIWGE